MNENYLKSLEFDKIRLAAASFAYTETAAENLRAMTPGRDIGSLNAHFEVVQEALSLVNASGRLPAFGYHEVSDAVQRTQKGGIIRNEALLAVAGALRFAQNIRRYIYTADNPGLTFPGLERITADLEGIPSLEKDITKAILSAEDIADDASPALYAVRRQMRQTAASVKDKLSSLITNSETKKFLQESLVTMRSGRYVVPVKNEYKTKMDGIVHDSSNTGQTLYIEPAAVVALNNRLRELEAEEEAEIERILSELSQKVAASAARILNNERVILSLDELFARAAYAQEGAHTKPILRAGQILRLNKARHPLLDAAGAVASDITLGDAFTQIVITGPNTGGKTVTLKTIGLCAMMAACGLFVPCQEGSILCTFDQIFSDIGDEQSIAQSLSTFSSHMSNIINILDSMTPECLILLDEVGAGTDPSEGAALAWAILERILASGALSAATTHYSEIKRYALTTPGVVNASMEFDVEKLMPAYRFHIGVPGKSNAFEISRRLGLSEDVLADAARHMKSDTIVFEDLLSQLDDKLRRAEESYAAARAEEQRAAELRKNIESDLKAFQAVRDREFTKSAIEAKQIITNAKKTARELIAEAEKATKTPVGELRNTVAQKSREALEAVNEFIPENRVFIRDEGGGPISGKLKAGDNVFIPELNVEGSVVQVFSGEAQIQVGSIKTRLPLSRLRMSQESGESSRITIPVSKSRTISANLDIRGITAMEVPIEVEKYLDDASLAGLRLVTIVHGKGNGVLKKAVAEVLRSSPLVSSFKTAGLKEGGDGATVASLE